MDKDRIEAPLPRPEYEFAHELYCNACRDKPVGCGGCSCRAGREIKKLRGALKIADDSIRHHLRHDEIAPAMIQSHAVAAIREALKE